jgi:hypothetical protein
MALFGAEIAIVIGDIFFGLIILNCCSLIGVRNGGKYMTFALPVDHHCHNSYLTANGNVII